MKVTKGSMKLDPQTLFRVEASHPPLELRTMREIVQWQEAEALRAVDETCRLFREQCMEALREFVEELEASLVKH